MVGDMSCVGPLPTGKVSGVGVALTSHFAAPMGQLYGWLPLSNAYGISNLKTWL